MYLIELPKPLSHYSIDKYPFVFIPTFEEAIRVAELDLDTYVSLVEELEVDYKPPQTLFFSNTARCASTLFGSMLQHENHSTVIAEHHALTILSIGLKEGYWNDNVSCKLYIYILINLNLPFCRISTGFFLLLSNIFVKEFHQIISLFSKIHHLKSTWSHIFIDSSLK